MPDQTEPKTENLTVQSHVSPSFGGCTAACTGGSDFTGGRRIRRVKFPDFMNFLTETVQLIHGIVGVGLHLKSLKGVPIPDDTEFMEVVKPFRDTCDGEESFTIPLLSSSPHPLGLFGSIHGHFKEKSISDLKLSLRRKPESSPPTAVQEKSDLAGGWPWGFYKFLTVLKEPETLCEVQLRGWVMDTNQTPIVVNMREKVEFPGFKVISEKVTLESESPPCNGLEIELIKDSARFTISSNLMLKLNGQCMEKACETTWPILKPIFK